MLRRRDYEGINHEAQLATRHVMVDYDRCSYCGACVPVCPSASIVLHDATILINPDACTRCERCIIICPTGALAWSTVHEAQL
jgi:ferredoxin